jgi:hypothetical protein
LVKPPFYPTVPTRRHERTQSAGKHRLPARANGVTSDDALQKENAMWPTISLEELPANPCAAIHEIAASEKVFLLTENGQPILDIRPYRTVLAEKLRGSVVYCGDIVSPVEDPFR